MNWGKKIAVLYLSFVALIITLVSLCFGQKVELESKDYYAQELKFQDKINAIANEKKLTSSITHLLQNKQILLTADTSLTQHGFEGAVKFFRPSDSSKDVSYELNFINNQQRIPTRALVHGVYKMQLSWVSNSISYFKEEVIFID